MTDEIQTTEDEVLNHFQQQARQREIEQHNIRVDYAKAYKKRKTQEEIEVFQRAVVEELIVAWSKESMMLRLPCVVVSGIAIRVAEFFKSNFRNVPNCATYDEMEVWTTDVSNYLNGFDAVVFNYMTKFIEPIEFKNDATEKDQIGSSRKFFALFKQDTLFFMGRDLWKVFTSNKNVHDDPTFELVMHHEELLTGKLGKFRCTTMFTDGFRHPKAECFNHNEGFFVSIPLVQTLEIPRLQVTHEINAEQNDRGEVGLGDKFYTALSIKVTGTEFVKLYCNRVVLT